MARLKKKKKIKNISPVQVIIRSSGNSHSRIVRRSKHELTSKEVLSNSRYLCSSSFFSYELMIKERELKSYYNVLNFDSLDKAIAWSTVALKANEGRLLLFHSLEKKLENEIAASEYEKAKNTCKDIEESVGTSIWLMKIMLYLECKSGGDYKALHKRINDSEPHALLRFILTCYVRQLDAESSYFTYNDEHSKKLDEIIHSDPGYLAYLRYATLAPEYSLFDELEHISLFSFEYCTSIVDLLKIFNFSLSKQLLSSVELPDEWLNAVWLLGKEYPSTAVKSYYCAIGDWPQERDELIKTIKYVDSYTTGNYKSVLEQYLNMEKHSGFHAFEMAFKASLHEEDNPKILNYSHRNNLDSLLLGKEIKQSEFLDLVNDSSLLSGLDWFYDEHLFVICISFNLTEDKVKLAEKSYSLRSSIPSPNKAQYLPERLARLYINNVKILYPESSTLRLFSLYSNSKLDNTDELGSLDICIERKKKYQAIHNYLIGNYGASSSYYKELMISGNELVRHDASYGYIKSLVKNGDIFEAEKEICTLYFESGADKRRLPWEDVCAARSADIKNCNSIYTSVCFSLYKELFDEKYNTVIKVRFEMLLISHGLKDFEKLLLKFPEVSDKIKFYFLEFVCVSSVMQGPLLFSSSNEIEDVRISVCQRLIAAGVGNVESLRAEVKSISKWRALKEAKLHVEKTKIYVDVDYIKSKIESDCRVLRDKYVAICSSLDYVEKTSIAEEITDLTTYKELDRHPFITLKTIHIIDTDISEGHKLFTRMVKLVRDEFTRGLKGLSGYLSTRIIHGTLENHLSRAFKDQESGFSILQKSSNDRYQFELAEIIAQDDPLLSERVDKALSAFTNKFDAYLQVVLYKWLQVTQIELDFVGLGIEDKEAIFDYSISNVLIEHMRKSLGTSFTYEEFWQYVIDWLWIVTEENLTIARERLESKMIPDLREMYGELEAELSPAIRTLNAKGLDLSASLNEAKQKLIHNAQECIRWFRKSNYDLQQKIDFGVVVESVRVGSGINFDIKVEDGLSISGNYLTYYFDIIYILVLNAKKHCGINDHEMNLRVDVEGDKGNFKITVFNSCNRVSDIKAENERISKYSDIYNTSDVQERLNGVGGTGYYKMQKIIKEDLSSNFICDLAYTSECEFKTSLEIIK